jgi:hypothetical protein
MTIVPAKRTKDSLPLTSFKVEDKPCAKPTEVSISANAQFYPLERERVNADEQMVATEGCSFDRVSNSTYDDRYLEVGVKVSEYDVQYSSKVLESLHTLPRYYDFYTPDMEAVKRKTFYNFYTRPNIPWKLECEANQITREDLIGMYNNGAI